MISCCVQIIFSYKLICFLALWWSYSGIKMICLFFDTSSLCSSVPWYSFLCTGRVCCDVGDGGRLSSNPSWPDWCAAYVWRFWDGRSWIGWSSPDVHRTVLAIFVWSSSLVLSGVCLPAPVINIETTAKKISVVEIYFLMIWWRIRMEHRPYAYFIYYIIVEFYDLHPW